MAIRLVLAEDHYLVREGVRRLLETRPEFAVVAACDDLASLLAAVDSERPDVVTDIRVPPGGADEGIQAAERLRQSHPEVGVVVVSQYAHRSTFSRCWRAAADGAHTCSKSGSRISIRRNPRCGGGAIEASVERLS